MRLHSGQQAALRATRSVVALAMAGICASAHAEPSVSVAPLPSLDVPAYMGAWYQVAWFSNRFQKQCISNTSATYRQMPDGLLEVVNRCRREDGSVDSVTGLARPSGTAVLRGGQLEPAQLEVSFLPVWLLWLPVWGSYWVLELAPDGRYAVVSEPTREYLWVLARRPELAPEDETAIRSRLIRSGYDLSRWQRHLHSPADRPAGAAAEPWTTAYFESPAAASNLPATAEDPVEATASKVLER